ncbi:MAG: DnaJ domain-containing protein [Deltaproteobacteria bacterium]|nr:DnaJ domain-containing protein [Deltaproteobacteria bacterium]
MTAALPDHYTVLGLQPSATQEQIKAAYRRLALRLHPDKNVNNVNGAGDDQDEAFKRCGEAYNVLSDEVARERYDLQRLRAMSVTGLVGEMVHELFGGRHKRRIDGRHIEVRVRLTLAEAFTGARSTVSYAVTEVCRSCHGDGASPGGRRPCDRCGARGELREGGLLAIPRPCPRCGGQKQIIAALCKTCGGLGNVEVERSYRISLPAGIRDGERRHVAGQGEPGRFGGQAGDLRVLIQVEQEPLLKLSGDDILVELPVTFVEATLGSSREVPTLDGPVKMKIPPATESGRRFRLRGRGFRRRVGHGRGDQLVEIRLETPRALSEEAIEALRDFEQALPDTAHPLRQRYLDALSQAKSRLDDERS